jgi:hypothetical protein
VVKHLLTNNAVPTWTTCSRTSALHMLMRSASSPAMKSELIKVEILRTPDAKGTC